MQFSFLLRTSLFGGALVLWKDYSERILNPADWPCAVKWNDYATQTKLTEKLFLKKSFAMHPFHNLSSKCGEHLRSKDRWVNIQIHSY